MRALLAARSVCPDCGVEIRSRESPAYKRHLDGHVRAELGNQSTHESRPDFLSEDVSSRRLFVSSTADRLQEWVAHSFVDEVNRVDEPPAPQPVGEERPADGQPGDALSKEVAANQCAVCFEKFAEYWDDDEEEWRLRDCVLVGGKVSARLLVPPTDRSLQPVHRLCAADAKFDRSGPPDSSQPLEAAE